MAAETAEKRLYEGMFLVDSAQAGSDWEGVLSAVRNVLDRADAEVVQLKKWDERKLAYDIAGKSRGTYILTYFNADPARINGIDRNVRLNEKLMRALVLRAEHTSVEEIRKAEADAEKPADKPAAVEKEPAAEQPAAEQKAEPTAEKPQVSPDGVEQEPKTDQPEPADSTSDDSEEKTQGQSAAD